MSRRAAVLLVLATLVLALPAWAQEDSRLARARDLTNEARRELQAGRAEPAIARAEEALEIVVQTRGASHPEVATVLVVLAQALQDTGAHARATSLLERAVGIRERALGSGHADVAAVLTTLGWARAGGGDHAGAKRAFARALAIQRKTAGPGHPQTTRPLMGLAAAAAALGDHAEARAAYEQALRIRERALGPSHPDVASVLTPYGAFLRAQGESAGARAALTRALAIREQALGPTHVDVAATLGELAAVLRQTEDRAAARPLVERALAIREAAHGPTHPQVGQTLNGLGWTLHALGNYAGARRAFERALAIFEKALGPDHPQTARSLHGVALVLKITGDYPASRAAYERARAIFERALGASHHEVAAVLMNTGELLRVIGDHGGARAALERALGIQERAQGPSHPDVAHVLVRYGSLLRNLGEYAGARAALERALAIGERVFGADHPSLASPLYYLARVQAAAGEGRSAWVLAERSLAIRERALGPDHFDVGLSLAFVARLRVTRGEYAEARPLYARALRIYERSIGLDHRETALVLTDYAEAHRRGGDRAGARALLERSLAIQERVLGSEHPEVALTVCRLGTLLLGDGDAGAAEAALSRALAITTRVSAPDVRWRAGLGLGRLREREQRWAEAVALYRAAVRDIDDLAAQFGDEAERAQFLQGGDRLTPYDALAGALLKAHEREPGRGHDQEAWAILDAKKKRVAAETLSAARPALQDPAARVALQDALSRRDQAAALDRTLREERAKGAREQHAETIASLTTQLARTKAEYLAQVQGFLARYPQYKSQFVDQQTVDPKALAKFADRLPAGTVAVQYFAAPDQLYVFVVASGGKFQVRAQAIGQAELFRLVRRYRELVELGVKRPLAWNNDGSESYRRDVVPLKAVTRELSTHLLTPIEPELRASQGLIVIPNDLLLYLPFAALVREAPDGTLGFLAGTHAVSYVTQLELTDLLGPATAAPDAPLLAVANPDGTLPAASREVRAIAGMRPAVTTLDGAQATKATFLSQAGRFPDLHLATHGVLDPERPERSYLVLSGADEASQRLGIGEIAGLSLKSGLTVLSACETALGEQVPGAALITLAAAFSQAGAQSIVASLWRVNDVATRTFMVAFYRNLASGRAAALRAAQQRLLADHGTAHPFYWASFILMGAR